MNTQTDKTSVATSIATSVDIKRILEMIPHRYPMLMVDKVTEMLLSRAPSASRTSASTSRSSRAISRPSRSCRAC